MALFNLTLELLPIYGSSTPPHGECKEEANCQTVGPGHEHPGRKQDAKHNHHRKRYGNNDQAPKIVKHLADYWNSPGSLRKPPQGDKDQPQAAKYNQLVKQVHTF